jgi:hypothetical protein
MVTELASTRRKNSKTVENALRNNSWISDITGELSVEGCVQCIRLWQELVGVQRNEQSEDKFTWKGSTSWQYTASDTYKLL